MPLIRAEALGEDYEDKQLADGKHRLVIKDAKYGPTKKGDRHMIALMIVAPEEEGTAPINHFLIIPNDEDEPRNRRLFMRNIKRTLVTFGYPTDKDFDPEENAADLVNLEADVETKQEEGDDGEMYARLRLPKLD